MLVLGGWVFLMSEVPLYFRVNTAPLQPTDHFRAIPRQASHLRRSRKRKLEAAGRARPGSDDRLERESVFY